MKVFNTILFVCFMTLYAVANGNLTFLKLLADGFSREDDGQYDWKMVHANRQVWKSEESEKYAKDLKNVTKEQAMAFSARIWAKKQNISLETYYVDYKIIVNDGFDIENGLGNWELALKNLEKIWPNVETNAYAKDLQRHDSNEVYDVGAKAWADHYNSTMDTYTLIDNGFHENNAKKNHTYVMKHYGENSHWNSEIGSQYAKYIHDYYKEKTPPGNLKSPNCWVRTVLYKMPEESDW